MDTVLQKQIEIRKFRSPQIEKDYQVPEDFLKHPHLDIEIGCGVGLHPIQYCMNNPDRRLIAIEHTREKFEKFQRRVAHHPQINNLLPVHANAITYINNAIPNETVSKLFLLYPNPYPKKKQLNKRWYAMPFMGTLKDKLKTGGTLTLATNIDTYALEAKQYLTEFWKFKLTSDEELTNKMISFTPRTHFEKKYLSNGEICHNLVFTKSILI